MLVVTRFIGFSVNGQVSVGWTLQPHQCGHYKLPAVTEKVILMDVWAGHSVTGIRRHGKVVIFRETVSRADCLLVVTRFIGFSVNGQVSVCWTLQPHQCGHYKLPNVTEKVILMDVWAGHSVTGKTWASRSAAPT